ncbi:uncharacterized protein [Penaeus vannamei]|uniref:uncharacterized protein n=1 Tax=Penaeus vannamei TaxID=6689 RepID=UPI00387F5182
MGAGSAKGLQQPEEDDEDRFSSSSEQWGNDQSASDDSGRKDRDTSPESDIAPKTIPSVENGESSGHEEMEGKRRGLFTFSKKKDDPDKDKVDDFVDETNEDDKKKKGGTKNNKNNAKKDNEKKGFRLFGWRKDDKKNEKDEALDEDINDLEKTFDSLGIVGKNSWGDAPAKPQKEAVDDLELLEPMRKRKNVRVRGPKGMNGVVAGGTRGQDKGGSGSSDVGSTTSRRTFKYSWETETGPTAPKQQEDEWEYKAVVIEGFDIEKFRKANVKEQVFDSASLPNAIGDDFTTQEMKSPPLRYDQNEQQILASIERDFIH